jgi:hypothetical protein
MSDGERAEGILYRAIFESASAGMAVAGLDEEA